MNTNISREDIAKALLASSVASRLSQQDIYTLAEELNASFGDNAPTPAKVTLRVHHGDYRAVFHGVGDTLEEAAKQAALQSTYSADLFDESGFMSSKAKEIYRREMLEAFDKGEDYNGYGWCSFSAAV